MIEKHTCYYPVIVKWFRGSTLLNNVYFNDQTNFAIKQHHLTPAQQPSNNELLTLSDCIHWLVILSNLGVRLTQRL